MNSNGNTAQQAPNTQSMNDVLSITLLSSDNHDVELIKEEFRKANVLIEILEVKDTNELRESITSAKPSVVVVEYSFTHPEGMEVLRLIKENNLSIPVVVISATTNQEIAVQCIKEGAADYLTKSSIGRLVPAVHSAIQMGKVREEKEQIYEELIEKEQRYRHFFEQDLTANYISTPDGQLLDCNPAFLKLLGFDSLEQALSQNLYTIYNDKDQRNQHIKLLQEEHTLERYEYTLRNRKGGQVDVVANMVGVFNTSGDLVQIRGFLFDVTERKRAIELLKENEQRYRSLIETAGSMVIGLTTDFRVFEWNHEAEVVYGYSKGEVLDQNYLEFFLDKKRQAPIIKDLKQVLRGRPTRNFESRIRRKDQTSRTILWNVSRLLNFNQKPIGLIAIGQDITERKQAEQILLETKKEAELANQAKGDFLANMSHEIRTPMNAIMGFSYLLSRSSLSAEQMQHLVKIKESSSTLMNIINDILDYSKIESRQIDFEKTEFDLHRELAQAVKSQSNYLTNKTLDFIYEIDPSLPRFVEGDAQRLRQVLANLVSNALKFTKEGFVTVKAWSEEVSGDHFLLKCSVTDTGIGIAEEDQERIFAPFTQSDMSSTRRYGGTGLGLSIARQIVEAWGGRIDFKSAVNKGSEFSFTVRLKAKSASNIIVAPELSQKHLTLISSSPRLTKHLKKTLHHFGVTITTLVPDSPLDKIERALKKSHFVFLDIEGAEQTILEKVKYLNKTYDLLNRAMIFYNVAYLDDYLDLYKSEGFIRFLEKPLIQDELRDQLTEIIRKDNQAGKNPMSRELNTEETNEDRMILLAEDNYFNQVITIKLLKNLGYKVLTARNGKEVLDQFTSHEFVLILMDIQMPEMDGFEASRAVREIEKESGSHIPIIAMTAFALQGDKERCIEAGMGDYISKPVRQGELKEALSQYLK